jgi:putative NADPH-quinone reductase
MSPPISLLNAMSRKPQPGRRVLIIQGHPDVAPTHYGHALAASYADGATAAGHEVRQLFVARLGFPWVSSKESWEGRPPEMVADAQRVVEWAEHIVILFPLWLGAMPAVLKAFFEQVLRPGFAVDTASEGKMWKKHLSGRTAHVAVTMGMPAAFYRIFYGAHSVKSLERNILAFCGIDTVRTSLVGMVEAKNPSDRQKWLARMRKHGSAAN